MELKILFVAIAIIGLGIAFYKMMSNKHQSPNKVYSTPSKNSGMVTGDISNPVEITANDALHQQIEEDHQSPQR